MFPPAFYSTNPTQKKQAHFSGSRSRQTHGVIWGSNSCGMLRSITSWGWQTSMFRLSEESATTEKILWWWYYEFVYKLYWLFIQYSFLSCRAKPNNCQKSIKKNTIISLCFLNKSCRHPCDVDSAWIPKIFESKGTLLMNSSWTSAFFYFSSCHSSPFLSESIGRHPLVISHDLIICSCVWVRWRRWRSLSLILG